jgi:hypothetical protein
MYILARSKKILIIINCRVIRLITFPSSLRPRYNPRGDKVKNDIGSKLIVIKNEL